MEPMPRQETPAPGGTSSRVNVAYIRGQRVEKLFHRGSSLGRHDQDTSVGLYDDQILHATEHNRVPIRPDDAILRLMQGRPTHHYVSLRILRANAGQRLPGSNIVPRKRATHHSNRCAALQKAYID